MEQPGGWRVRRSIDELRVQWGSYPPAHWTREDSEENQATRLPPDRQVKLCSLMLVEVFTPATHHTLIESYRRLPFLSAADVRRVGRELAATRSTDSAEGPVAVCSVRPGTEQHVKAALQFHDRHLPAGVEAVEISRHSPVPSLTVIVAAFSITAAAGDLTPLLRRDYPTTRSTVEVDVPGALGSALSRFGWYRPKVYSPFLEDARPAEQRTRACEQFMADVELGCTRWLSSRFAGYYARADTAGGRPSARCLITDLDPFPADAAAARRLQAVGLSEAQHSWQAYYGPEQRWERIPWWLTESPPQQGRGATLTVARQVDDFEESHDYSTSWVIGHNFRFDHAPLVARWAVRPTLMTYAHTLAQVRDSTWRHRRSVASARHLTRYMAEDGIDIATVSAEIIGWPVDRARLGKDYRRPDPPDVAHAQDWDDRSFGEAAWQQTVSTAAGLRDNYTAVVSVISSFAQLRQSTTNTNLQRAAVVIAVVALIVAVLTPLYTATPAAP